MYTNCVLGWKGFNDFSIGIELVNYNGNVFPYTDQQYEALAQVILHLKSKYSSLKQAKRIVGHEHISGFRGKADHGHLFDWKRFLR